MDTRCRVALRDCGVRCGKKRYENEKVPSGAGVKFHYQGITFTNTFVTDTRSTRTSTCHMHIVQSRRLIPCCGLLPTDLGSVVQDFQSTLVLIFAGLVKRSSLVVVVA